MIQTAPVARTRYYMTAKVPSETGYWEPCRATSLRGAKAECTRRFGAGWRDALLCVADEWKEILSQRQNTATRWVDQA